MRLAELLQKLRFWREWREWRNWRRWRDSIRAKVAQNSNLDDGGDDGGGLGANSGGGGNLDGAAGADFGGGANVGTGAVLSRVASRARNDEANSNLPPRNSENVARAAHRAVRFGEGFWGRAATIATAHQKTTLALFLCAFVALWLAFVAQLPPLAYEARAFVAQQGFFAALAKWALGAGAWAFGVDVAGAAGTLDAAGVADFAANFGANFAAANVANSNLVNEFKILGANVADLGDNFYANFFANLPANAANLAQKSILFAPNAADFSRILSANGAKILQFFAASVPNSNLANFSHVAQFLDVNFAANLTANEGANLIINSAAQTAPMSPAPIAVATQTAQIQPATAVAAQTAPIFPHVDPHALALFYADIPLKTLLFRAPVLAFALLNAVLIFRASKFYVKREGDRFLCLALYLLLPATLVGAAVFTDAPLVLSVTLLALIFYEKRHFGALALALLAGLLIPAGGALALYVATLFYGLYSRTRPLVLIGAILSLAALYLANAFALPRFERSHLLQTLATYAVLLSPLVFAWFAYCLYRVGVRESRRYLWFVVVCGFFMCVATSMRQAPQIAVSLAYAVVFVAVMMQTFLTSFRIRLPIFRRFHCVVAWALAVSLAINAAALCAGKWVLAASFGSVGAGAQRAYGAIFLAGDVADELRRRGVAEVCFGGFGDGFGGGGEFGGGGGLGGGEFGGGGGGGLRGGGNSRGFDAELAAQLGFFGVRNGGDVGVKFEFDGAGGGFFSAAGGADLAGENVGENGAANAANLAGENGEKIDILVLNRKIATLTLFHTSACGGAKSGATAN